GLAGSPGSGSGSTGGGSGSTGAGSGSIGGSGGGGGSSASGSARALGLLGSNPSSNSVKASEIQLVLNFVVGKAIAGTEITISFSGMEPGSNASIIMHSQPTTLGIVTVPPSGSYSGRFRIASAPPGSHEIIVNGKSVDGTLVTASRAFEVNNAGVVTGISSQQSGISPGASVASSRSNVIQVGGVSYASYSVSSNPGFAAQTMIAVFALLALVGSGRTRQSQDSSGGSGAHAASREKTKKSGSLASAKVEHLKFKHDAKATGDRSGTWEWPLVDWLDERGLTLPHRLNGFSPLAARLVNDSAYIRAMFGSMALLAPLAGLVLGVLGVINTHGQAVPPTFGIFMAVIVLSIVDSLGGFIAAAVFFIGVAANGGIESAASLRGLLGITIIFFAGGLAASGARPLRRVPPKAPKEWFDRSADPVIGALVGMLAIDKMIGALPALSGIDFPIVESANHIAFIVGFLIIGRYVVESIAAHFYPERLAACAPSKMDGATKTQQGISNCIKTLIFVFFAVAYLGNVWELYVGAALFLIPSLISTYADSLPNFEKLVKFMPAGMIKLVGMMCIGNLFATFVHDHISAPAEFLALGSVILGLPGLVLGLVGNVAREGDTFKLNWFYRLGGIGVVAFGVLLTEGVVSISWPLTVAGKANLALIIFIGFLWLWAQVGLQSSRKVVEVAEATTSQPSEPAGDAKLPG
ncbi:MAG TPA: hypothetical protein VMU77_00065, partial [Acidimicrobiales bacterium]|nr:hypothetical protein [Acidimicrobiales bacterium]